MNQATGNLRKVLRCEGLAILILSTLAFTYSEASWILFALLFLAPDLSLIGYLLGSKAGAMSYNATHSIIGPTICIGVGILTGYHTQIAIGLIWSAHIGFDRSLGYGLKYTKGFKHTHLGKIGK